MSEQTAPTPQELSEMCRRLIENPDEIPTIEDATEMRRHLNPLGNIPNAGDELFVNMSIHNWSQKYIEKFTATAMIGYIFQLASEYEPEPLIDRIPAGEDKETVAKEITQSARALIKHFLNRHFSFNPNAHVRSAKTSAGTDPERQDDLIRQTVAAESLAEEHAKKLSARPDATFQWLKGHMLAVTQEARAAKQAVDASAGQLLALSAQFREAGVDSSILDDAAGILMKKSVRLGASAADLDKIAAPFSRADVAAAVKVSPSVNLFHQFGRYATNNYERLRDVTRVMYNEKPDLEFAAVVYSVHADEVSAREWKIKHESELRADVITISNGGITLLGPFKENRDRVDFYNKNTEVIKRMMEQVEADHKLGEDIMKKTARDKKKKNIEEAGPDAPGLTAYHKHSNTVKELGAKKILTKAEQEQLAEAKAAADAIKEDYEVPDDCISYNVYTQHMKDGVVESLQKHTMYTAAEAPTHMEDSPTDNRDPVTAEKRARKARGRGVEDNAGAGRRHAKA